MIASLYFFISFQLMILSCFIFILFYFILVIFFVQKFEPWTSEHLQKYEVNLDSFLLGLLFICNTICSSKVQRPLVYLQFLMGLV